jgi:hypothetical protein
MLLGKKIRKRQILGTAWWYILVIPTLGRPKQEDNEFPASVSDMMSQKLKEKEKPLK